MTQHHQHVQSGKRNSLPGKRSAQVGLDSFACLDEVDEGFDRRPVKLPVLATLDSQSAKDTILICVNSVWHTLLQRHNGRAQVVRRLIVRSLTIVLNFYSRNESWPYFAANATELLGLGNRNTKVRHFMRRA